MSKKETRLKRIKVIIIGIENSGKTTLVRSLSPNAKSIEHASAGGDSITVGLDIGTIQLAGHSVHFFGTPGHARFKFVRKIVSQGAHIGILMIDSVEATKIGISQRDKDYEQELIEKNIPYFICANKRDMPGVLPLSEIMPHFNAEVHPLSAKTGEGIAELSAVLVDLIEAKEAGLSMASVKKAQYA